MTSRIEHFSAELLELDDRFREIEDDQSEIVKEHLPIGAVIKYSRGDRHYDATVIRHNSYGGDRIYVQGTSGTKYWVSVHRVVSIDWVPDSDHDEQPHE